MSDNEIYYVTNIYPPVTLSLKENGQNLVVIFDYRVDCTYEILFDLEHTGDLNFKFKDSFPELRKKFPFEIKDKFPNIYSKVFLGVSDLLKSYGLSFMKYDLNEMRLPAWIPLGGFKIFFSNDYTHCDLFWGMSRMGTFDRSLHFTPSLEVDEPDWVIEAVTNALSMVKDTLMKTPYFYTEEHEKRLEK